MRFLLLVVLILLLALPNYAIEIGTVEEAPGNFTNEDGNIVGLSVDFVKEIQKRVGDNSVIEMLPATRLFKYAKERDNYVLFTLSRTESREDQFYWISLVMRKPLIMFVKKGSDCNITNLKDAKNVDAIGVVRGSVQDDFLVENNFINIVPGRDHEQNLNRLLSGRIDVLYHSMHGLAKLCRDMNLDLNEFEPVLILQISNSSIAMSKNSDTSIVRQWQEAAEEIKADGTFDRLAQKWLEYTEEYIGIPSEIRDGALNFWRE